MSGDVTYQALKRLTHLPDRTAAENGSVIAGQEYYDVDFTGGSIRNVSLTDVVINGVTTARNERIITASGNVTVQNDDYVITVNKTVPEITTVTLPASPSTSRSIIVKDGAGNSGSFNITISGNGKTIDGAASYILNGAYQNIEMIFNGTEWNILNVLKSSGQSVIGPASSTDNDVATFNGTSGALIKDSGVAISNVALKNGNLGQFATTTSAQLAAVISDETGSGSLVFANSPVLTTPNIGDATATSINTVAITGSGTPTLAVTGTSSISGSNTGDQTTISGNAGTATKLQTARTIAGTSFDGSANIALSNKFIVQGTSDAGLSATQFLGSLGTGILKNTTTTGVLSIAVAADFPTLNQNTTGNAATVTTNANLTGAITSVGNATSLGSFSSANLAGALTDETGTGVVVFSASPALTGTPTAPTATVGTNTTQLATTAFVLANGGASVKSVKSQIFTSSGTYTPSTGMIYCIVQGCGGGGQGGCCTSLVTSIGAGGGGGAFGLSLITAATIGASKSVTIGIGGSTSIAGANNGQAGGQTSLGTLAIFPGGGGGANLSSLAGVGGAGGSSPTCDVGSSGYNGGAVVVTGSISGIGANGPFGRGGAEIVNGIGNSGAGFGSGGGGAKGNNTSAAVGGSGTPGIIYITEFCTQ